MKKQTENKLREYIKKTIKEVLSEVESNKSLVIKEDGGVYETTIFIQDSGGNFHVSINDREGTKEQKNFIKIKDVYDYVVNYLNQWDLTENKIEIKESSFSRQHYNLIANVIKSSRTKEEIVSRLADIFGEDNPNFIRDKFLQVAGVKDKNSQTF